MDQENDIEASFRLFRAAFNLTQADFAKLLGLSTVSISNIENKNWKVSSDTAERLLFLLKKIKGGDEHFGRINRMQSYVIDYMIDDVVEPYIGKKATHNLDKVLAY